MVVDRIIAAFRRGVGREETVESRIGRGPIAVEITDDATIVADATHALRHGHLPLWAGLRARLGLAGIAPDKAVMADSYGIDPYGIEVGIVLGGGRVIEYRYDGDFVEWEDIIRQLQDEGRASG